MGEGNDWITREISQEDEPLRRHYLPDAGALLSQVLPDRPPRCAFFINFFVLVDGRRRFSAVDPVVCCLGHFEVFFFSLFCHFLSILKNVQQAPSIRSGSESSKQTWLACQIGLDSLRMLGRIESTRGNCGRQRAEANADMIVFINKGSVTKGKMDF